MINTQLGRWNLPPQQRIAVAEKYRPIYEKQARKNQLSGLKQNQNTVSQNSSKRTEPIDVHAKLAKIAGVGTGTVARFNKVMNSDDEELKDLIESNIRRRGEVGGSAKKIGKRIKELERLYGVYQGEHGSNQYMQNTNNSDSAKTQKQLASQMGISIDTLQNYKMLSDMIPEKELERVYGIELGSNQRTSNNYKFSKSQEELAKMAGIGTGTIARYNRVMNSDEIGK